MTNTPPVIDDAHRFGPAAPESDIVYGACCPGWHTAATHEVALDQWLASMRAKGIKRICCLLTGRQLDDNDANIGQYRQTFGADAVLHAPIPDRRLAGVEMLSEQIFPFLDDAVAANEPVVVHGLAGIARTGQVLAAWLVYRHGYGPNEAIETVRDMGRDPLALLEQGDTTRADLIEILQAIA